MSFVETLDQSTKGFFMFPPNLSRFSLGGGLDLVDLGFIFDDFFTVFSLLPPLIGLFNKVFKADSVLNSHFMMVSLTKKRKNIIAN